MQDSNRFVAVVEDDCAIRIAIERLLRAAGYRAELYHSAEKFLEHADFDAIDCLLLDINLPGMSGLELQKRLLPITNAPPIIFITSETNVFSLERAVDNLCVAYLNKPVKARELWPALEIALLLSDATRKARTA